MNRIVDTVRPEVNENLPVELDRIFAAIHASDPTAELCWLMAPSVSSDQIEMSWLPAADISIAPEGDVTKNVVQAMRVVACDLLAAAKRVEEACR